MARPPRRLTATHASTCLIRVLFAFALVLAAFASIAAQSTTPTSSTTSALTPGGMSPGTPTGAYRLSGFDNVNLFNGNLNVRIPLLDVGGRGNAGYTMMVSTNSKTWQVRTEPGRDTNGGGGNMNDRFFPQWNQWNTLNAGYGPGVMQGRKTGSGTMTRRTCDTCVLICPRLSPMYRYTLTRLTFIAADGTEHELRDELTGGKPMLVAQDRCQDAVNVGAGRGYRFSSADGSAMTFVSDNPIYDDVRVGPGLTGSWIFSPTGTLYLRDGTHYRIENGVVTGIEDRNGNRVTIAGGPAEITDSLNRKITIEYDLDEAPYGLHDRITYHGFGGAPRIIRVSKRPLAEALRAPYTPHTMAELFPDLNGSLGFSGNFNPQVTWAVWLPDGRKYQIFYNSYAEVARIELPTGGAMEYDMTPGSGVIVSSGATASGIEERQIYRRVLESRIYKGATADTLVSRTAYVAGGSMVRVEEYDGQNHLLALTNHYFSGEAAESLFTREEGSLYSPAGEGREIATDSLNTLDQSAVLRRVVTTSAQRAPVSWVGHLETRFANYPAPGLDIQPDNDPRVIDTFTILEPTGANLVSRTTAISPIDQSIGFDAYNNPTDIWEYDFGVGAAGGLMRHTHTNYVIGTDYTDTNSPHLLSLPAQTSIFDATGIEKARTTLEYDNYTPDAYHASLISRANISGWNDTYTSSFLTRGNVTATTRYLLDTSGAVTGSVTAYAQYDIAGNPVKMIDARGNAVTFDFRDNFGAPDGIVESGGEPVNSPPTELSGQSSYAFPFRVTNALGHVSFAKFDYDLGRVVEGEDANGTISSGSFSDSLDRPTQVISALNDPSAKSQTKFIYDDVARTITTRGDQTTFDDRVLKTELVYDGLGQTIETRQYENESDYIAVRKVPIVALQDGGNWLAASQTSNPFRPYLNEQPVWTTSFSDALGRVIKVKPPDSAVVTTSYSGNTVTVTDQAGKRRRSVTDALGRLVRVDEPDLNGSLDVNGVPAQSTSYSYDTLDDLIQVNQGGQIRAFVYDSLKRLLSANNPESGTTCYGEIVSGGCQADGYDANGNLVYKTDARHVLSTYAYDALNRNTSVTYSDGTPSVYRYYDSSVNGKGRLAREETSGVSTNAFDSYDVLGRPTQYSQRFWVNNAWGENFTITASYDKAGQPLSESYPSGRWIAYSYDAAGRLESFSGNLGDNQRTYSTGSKYSPFGALTQEQFGTATPVYNKRHYNTRGQLYDVRASTASLTADEWNWNRGAILNWYDSASNFTPQNPNSGADNDGNLLRQEVYVPDNDQVSSYSFRRQNYCYDSLNRLTSVAEFANGTTQSFAQSYTYDRWGNRTIDTAPTKSWGAGVNNQSLSANTTNNRLTVPNGQSGTLAYDDAGNLINDTYTGSGAREYDAENRMTRAWANNKWQVYTYDGHGQRIKRKVNDIETWQVYSFNGDLLGEYAANASPSSPQKEYGYRNGELLITAEPSAGAATSATFAATDTTTQGNWKGVFGADGYNVINDTASYPSYATVSVSGQSSYTWAATTSDTRALQKTGATTDRLAACWYSPSNFTIDINLTDGNTHRVALYTIDWDGGDGRQERIEVLDAATNAVLDSRDVTIYTSGKYLIWSLRGHVKIKFTHLTPAGYSAVLSGIFFGAAGNATNSATFVATDTTTQGSWKGHYGADGYSVVNDAASYPTYASVSVSGQSSYTWVGSTTDARALQKAASTTDRLAACWYSGTNFTLDVNLTDGNIHRVALYTIDWDGGDGRQERIEVLDADTNAVLDSRAVTIYTSGKYLVWTLKGHVKLKFTHLTPAGYSAVVSGLFFDAVSSAKINWLVTDQLGTPRMVLDQSGSLANVSRHDYLPFGEEIGVGVGGRTTAQGYTANDNVRQKFTEKERDSETGLDYFGARYFSSSQGRFTSPDPLMASAFVPNPQTWNRYTYALNNPLVYADPDGMEPVFKDYKNLGKDERRILENSKITFGKGKDSKTLSGEALYNHMKANKQDQLAGLLNMTAGLADIKFTDGSRAIDYVKGITGGNQERIYADVDPALKAKMESISAASHTDGVRFIGPTGQAKEHKNGGINYDVTFRENLTEGPMQLSFASKEGFARMDMDMDEHCQNCGDASAEAAHLGDGIRHKFNGGTDPEYIHKKLTQRNIRPSYEVKK